MESSVTKHIFWAILFVSFNVVTPKLPTPDDSCPCKPANECSHESQIFHANSQVLILPCSGKHLVRCCSVARKPIESAGTTESLQSIDGTDLLAEESKEKEDLIEETTRFFEDVTTGVTRVDESSESYSTTESLETETPLEEMITLTTQIPKYSSLTRVSEKEDKRTTLSNAIATAATVNERMQNVPTQKPVQIRYFNRQQFPVPQLIRLKILKDDSTTAPAIIPSPQPEKSVHQRIMKKEREEVPLDSSEEDIIDEVMNFESTKILKESNPTGRFIREMKEAMEQKEESSVGKIKRLFPRKTILDNSYGRNVNFKFLSAPTKSVYKEMSSHLKQKMSLETSLTLDRATIQAVDEITKPRSRLAGLQNKQRVN